jgi:hypothetical protein
MSITIRRIFFIILVFVFVFIAYYLAMYAQGYKIDINPGSNKFLSSSQTGTISLKTSPQKADIYLNGKLLSNKTPYLIKRLDPGSYQIIVTKKDYQSWQKDIRVESGMSTNFENILLAKKKPKSENIYPGIKLFSPSQNNICIIDNRYNIYVYGIKNHAKNFILNLSDNGVSIKETSIINIKWNPNEKFLLISVRNDDDIQYFTISDLENKPKLEKAESLNNIANDQISFSDNKPDLIYFQKGYGLFSFNPTSQNFVDLNDKLLVKNYTIKSNGEIIFLNQDDGKINLYKEGDKNPNLLIETQLDPAHIFQLYYQNTGGKILLLDKTTQNLYINKENQPRELTKVISNVEDLILNPSRDRFLIIRGNEILIFYINEIESQPSHEAYAYESIARFSTPIDYINWVSGDENIIVSANNEIKLIELDGRGNRNSNLITAIQNENLPGSPAVHYDTATDTLFYINKGDLQSIIIKETPLIQF